MLRRSVLGGARIDQEDDLARLYLPARAEPLVARAQLADYTTANDCLHQPSRQLSVWARLAGAQYLGSAGLGWSDAHPPMAQSDSLLFSYAADVGWQAVWSTTTTELKQVSLTDWHHFEIEWLAQSVVFRVDDQEFGRLPAALTGPLGLVFWATNAVVTPEGTRSLVRAKPSWLEIKSLRVTALPTTG